MSAEQRRLSRREWLLIILVVVIGEYIFLDKVFKYGANEGIVSYISFAGTIVSIILAVLAIVYSYYQNFSQQRDSSNIATQIDVLRNTVNDVRVSKNEFVNELERINSISEKLDQSISILTESQTHVIRLSSSFENFRASFGAPSPQALELPGEEKLSSTQMNYFFHRLTEGTYLVLYALYRSNREKLKFSERFEKYYKDPFLRFSKENDDKSFPLDDNIYYALFTTTYSLFQSFGLVTLSEGTIKFDAEIERLIQTEIENGEVIKKENLKAVAGLIKEVT